MEALLEPSWSLSCKILMTSAQRLQRSRGAKTHFCSRILYLQHQATNYVLAEASEVQIVALDPRPPIQMSPASDRPGRIGHDRVMSVGNGVGAYALVDALDIAEGPLIQDKRPISSKERSLCPSGMQMASKMTRLMFRYPFWVEHITDTPTYDVLPAEGPPFILVRLRYYMAP